MIISDFRYYGLLNLVAALLKKQGGSVTLHEGDFASEGTVVVVPQQFYQADFPAEGLTIRLVYPGEEGHA